MSILLVPTGVKAARVSMPISATGTRAEQIDESVNDAAAGGFTLLELLVVIVLVSILATLSVLSVRGRDVQAVVEEETQRLFSLLSLAQEESIFSYRSLGVSFLRNGYGFRDFQDGSWQALDDRVLTERLTSRGVELRLYLEGRPVVLEVADDSTNVPRTETEKDNGEDSESAEGEVPHVVFFPDGLATPFELVVDARGAIERTIAGSPAGRLEIRRDEAIR
jgi:type II secretion system protein H